MSGGQQVIVEVLHDPLIPQSVSPEQAVKHVPLPGSKVAPAGQQDIVTVLKSLPSGHSQVWVAGLHVWSSTHTAVPHGLGGGTKAGQVVELGVPKSPELFGLWSWTFPPAKMWSPLV